MGRFPLKKEYFDDTKVAEWQGVIEFGRQFDTSDDVACSRRIAKSLLEQMCGIAYENLFRYRRLSLDDFEILEKCPWSLNPLFDAISTSSETLLSVRRNFRSREGDGPKSFSELHADHPEFAECLAQFIESNSPVHVNDDDSALCTYLRIGIGELEYLFRTGHDPRANWNQNNEEGYRKLAEMLTTGALHGQIQNGKGGTQLNNDSGSRLKSWQNLEVRKGLTAGAEMFGWKAMLDFAQRPGVELHDVFVGMPSAIEFFNMLNRGCAENSPRVPKTQFKTIFQQVVGDRAVYENGGGSHQEFYRIVGQQPDPLNVVQAGQQYRSLPRVNSYLEQLGEPEAVAQSWAALKKFDVFARLVASGETLRRLTELRENGEDPELVEMALELALRPESKVDANLAVMMAANPTEFFSRPGHTQFDGYDPINYTSLGSNGFHGSDLAPEELVRAFARRQLDGVQLFRPLTVEVTIPRRGEKFFDNEVGTEKELTTLFHDVRTGLRLSLGSRSLGERGLAANNKKLLQQVCGILKVGDIEGLVSLNEIKTNEITLAQLRARYSEPKKVLEAIRGAIFDQPTVGLPNNFHNPKSNDDVEKALAAALFAEIEGFTKSDNTAQLKQALSDLRKRNKTRSVTLRVTMQPKSSIDGIVAGDDTACCMPFGSRKANNYLFNSGAITESGV
jgi:hypothetical protein